jgi:NADH-quinone oxidoreductase subunit G
MIKLTINDIHLLVKKNTTVLQACENLGLEIPRFCYHEQLSIAGNCRMCLIEIEKSIKPVASCAMPVMEGMVIYTNTPLVKKARENILEFLLINHPLDCPICDQGGECDLQDQTLIYGSDRSRFYEFKRSVEDKNCGPLIKTIMTRCIHCTRCVRFASEVAGIEDFGMTGRGNKSEIGTFITKSFNSELSGNIIDLCPVGALTSKPYAFTARSWELRTVESIDILDSLGSNINIDYRGYEILRVLPRYNSKINGEWISDKTRFFYDGLKQQRLNTPFVKKEGKLVACSWKEAILTIRNKLNISKKVGGVFGSLVDTETLLVFKQFLNETGKFGSKELACEKNNFFNSDFSFNFRLNTTIDKIELADVCLLIGTNPRLEASLLNVRLRKKYLKGNLVVASIGNPLELTYPVVQLGSTIKTLTQIAEGKHSFCKLLKLAKNPIIICGSDILTVSNKDVILNSINIISKETKILQKNWNGVNFLSLNASQGAAFELGISKDYSSVINKLNKDTSYKNNILYLLGADDFKTNQNIDDLFIIYQGHHGDKYASKADVILPGFIFTEKKSTFINVEGRPQTTNIVTKALSETREDWKILMALSKSKYKNSGKLNYKNLKDIYINLYKNIPSISKMNFIETSNFDKININCVFKQHTSCSPLQLNIENFYMSDVISKSSLTMVKCSKVFKNNKNFL